MSEQARMYFERWQSAEARLAVLTEAAHAAHRVGIFDASPSGPGREGKLLIECYDCDFATIDVPSRAVENFASHVLRAVLAGGNDG